MTTADQIAHFLADHGMAHAFGIVGAGNVALFDAIDRLGKTEIVCTHHEQAAAQAAIGYYRASGRMAPVLLTTGAGSANAITGVLNAYMDGIPLLVISGNETSESLAGDCRVKGAQGYLTALVAAPACKWAMSRPKVELAYDIATRPPCGPVWMDVPRDYWSKEA